MPSLHQVFLECINFDCIGFSQFSLRVLINQSEETSNDTSNPVDNYMFKVINWNTRIRCEIYLKLTIKTPMAPLWCSYFTPWCPYFTPCSSVSIVKFQQIYAGWVTSVTADIDILVFEFMTYQKTFWYSLYTLEISKQPFINRY